MFGGTTTKRKSSLSGKFSIMPKLGYKQTEEHRAKIKANHARPFLGKKRPPFSDKWKKKISEAHKKIGTIPPSNI